MESLTPFIRHELEDALGPSGPPEETSSVVSPPLGAEPGQPPVTEPPKPGSGSQQPPSQPDGPDVQLPPPEVPQPRPDFGVPMTDGTPTACRQKNAAEYLAGRSPGVMTQYGDGLYARNPGCGSQQSLRTLSGARASLAAAPTAPPCFGRRPRSSPLPDEDKSGVLQLVEWREEAPYG